MVSQRPQFCLWLVIVSMCIAVVPAVAQADNSSDCYSIRDKDKQRYCLASVNGKPSRCYSIQDHDDKQLCLAEIKGQRSTCYTIRDKDTQRLCLAKIPR